jgi:protoporphyrinogen oxidase
LARPITPEVTLRDFIINRFGRELYATFFERYTEKVWGIPCEDIPADWGAQRIKGVSIKALLMNVLRKLKPTRKDISQKDTETSLIERFLYPKLGPGQLWEVVARKVQEKGGELHMQARVVGVEHANGRITSVIVEQNGKKERIEANFLFSSMPLQGLIKGWSPAAPAPIRAVSNGLVYRDFLTVGLLLDEINIGQKSKAAELRKNIPDNWVYIQDDDVKVGRLQIFNNWSPYLVADPDTIWMGLEYFVNEGDDLWSKPDDEMIAFGMAEMEKLGVAQGRDLRDAVVVRTKKAYPAYFGTYDQLDQLQDYAKTFDNLFCVGRNGMHRYNNQDHSMLTAMVAVDGLVEKRNVMDELWLINTEDEYHESK